MRYALELVKIFELLSSGARIDPLAEHVVLHMQPVGSDLTLHPLYIRLRRLDPAPSPAVPVGGGAGGGGEGAGARAGGEREEEEEEENGSSEDGEHEDRDCDDYASLGRHGYELGCAGLGDFSRDFVARDPIWGF